MKNHALVLAGETENRSMGDPATLVEYLEWAQKNYPADRTALVIWDHGGNAVKGFC